METRTITQIRIYKLILNLMTDCAESGRIAAISDDYDKLVAWYKEQFAPETYRDDRWNKTFKQGSPLEFFNPASSIELNDLDFFKHGIEDEWVEDNVYYDVCQSGRYFVV